jgi:omega-hydroxy-beta-dihydromenaquinone-9 sulfotransferase
MDNLIGIAYPEWRELKKEVNNDIDPEKRSIARRINNMSLWTWWRARGEMKMFGEAVRKTSLPDPVFILGHWRSGTTLLHNMLSLSDEFAYPRIYQVSNPHTFLRMPIERIVEQQHKVARTRKRPMDNVQFDIMSAAEDEFATCPMSTRSHMIGWSFLRQEPYYDRYLTFRNAPRADYERWRDALVWFLKKVVFKYNCCRPLLKSPQHTARTRLLLKEFPDAKFIHMRRNPYVVFRSTQRLFETSILPHALQKSPGVEFAIEGILRRYKEMYDAFFEDRALIPAGNYTEVAFEDLEQDMTGTVARAYEAVGLEGYAEFEPKLKAFVESQKEYQKNKHPQIEESLRRRIYATWQHAFDEFGYPA